VAAGAVTAWTGLQFAFGSAEDFFDYRFVTKKSPDALADFYGTEDFMQMYCVFPFVEELMMRGSHFDDDGVVHTYGLSGNMLVAMEFADDEDENGNTTFFNKRERFTDKAPWGVGLWWDLVENFGFNQRADGTCEVYHHGEAFYGPWPVRLIFELHARYLIWAAERHINSPAFGDDDKLEEREAMRKNIPAHVFNEYLAQMETDIKLRMEGDTEIPPERRVAVEKVLADIKKAKLQKHVTIMDVKQLKGDAGKALKTHETERKVQVTPAQLQLIIENKEVRETVKAGMQLLDKQGESQGRSLARRASSLENLLNHPDMLPVKK